MTRPEIVAQFELKASGEPEFIQQQRYRHYRLRLHVRAVPDETYAVTYTLHDSYPDPVRECLDRESGFEIRLTSYGDYTVQAHVRSKSGSLVVARLLSSALRAGHSSKSSPQVEDALRDVLTH